MKSCFNCKHKDDCILESEECEDNHWRDWESNANIFADKKQERHEQKEQQKVHDPDAPIKGMEDFFDITEKETKETAPKNHEQENKPQMSLIPMDLLRDFLEPAYREGLIKYYRESWRKGFKSTVMMDALQRHLTQWFYEGQEFDPDAEKLGVKKHHLGGALFCLLCLCDTVSNHPELDDRSIKNETDDNS